MIATIEIQKTEPFVGGAEFGAVGAYIRIDGVATGTLDPSHPGNRGIALLERAPRNADGLVPYRAGFTILRPVEPAQGNGRILYEVNNRGRIMLFAAMCAGNAGNEPEAAADLGNALPLRLGFTLMWSGWDAGAPAATGLSLEVPVIEDLIQPIREEFVSATRLGNHEAFRLTYEAATPDIAVTVRRTQTAPRANVSATLFDSRTVRPETSPKPGSIYEVRYTARKPRVLGIGFAAIRDIVSHVRSNGASLLGRPVTHVLAFGISQAGRYLRDHVAQGLNRDESGQRVLDGVFTHVAGIGRLFYNTPFAQPFRTRIWHEDHDFPEVVFPFSAATQHDPITGATAGLLAGDGSDPKLIETNTSTEYWQKGASLLHTDPLGTTDIPLPDTVRGYFLAGTQHGGKAGMPRDRGPCVNPRNWHDPMAAVRALLVVLDEWVVFDRTPPDSQLPRIADGTLVSSEALVAGDAPAPNDVTVLLDWTEPRTGGAYKALVPQVDADGNEIAGLRLPDIAVPIGTFTGWNRYAPPWPDGELADRDGSFLAFPDPVLAERHPGESYRMKRAEAVDALLADRLLLAEDAEAYRSIT
jgi:hypothetical protein